MVFQPGKVLEQGDGVVVIDVSSFLQNLDCHVDASREDGSVQGPTPTFRELGVLAEVRRGGDQVLEGQVHQGFLEHHHRS